MSLKQTIETDFVEAFKAKNMVKKNTLGILKTRISEWSSDKKNAGKEIVDADIVTILASEVKKRNQSIEAFSQNGSETAKANIEKEQTELDILKFYLPTQMTEDAIRTEITNIQSGLADKTKLMPSVMGHFNKNFKGQYDNKQLQEILKTF